MELQRQPQPRAAPPGSGQAVAAVLRQARRGFDLAETGATCDRLGLQRLRAAAAVPGLGRRRRCRCRVGGGCTAAGGVQITARSGTVGRSAARANTGWPSSSRCLRLTAWTGPLNAPLPRFFQTMAQVLCLATHGPALPMALA